MSSTKFICKLFKFKKILKVIEFEFTDRNRTLTIVVKPNKNGCRCPKCERRCEIVCQTQVMRQWREALTIHAAMERGINHILKIVKNRASGFRNLAAFSDMIYLTIGDLDIPNQIPFRFHTI